MNSLHDTLEVIDISEYFWEIIYNKLQNWVTCDKICINSTEIWYSENDIDVLSFPNIHYDPFTDYYVYDSFSNMLDDIALIYSHACQKNLAYFYRYNLIKNAQIDLLNQQFTNCL